MEWAHWLERWPLSAVLDPILLSVSFSVMLGHGKAVQQWELHGSTSRWTVSGSAPYSLKHFWVTCCYFISCLYTLIASVLSRSGGSAILKVSVLRVIRPICWAAFAPISGVSCQSTTRNTTENFSLFFGLWRVDRQEPHGFSVVSLHICSIFVMDSGFLSATNLTGMTFIEVLLSTWNLISFLSTNISV